MSQQGWRADLVRRIGWSLGAATVWVWGLLLLRMIRDGPQPLEVWFGYSLSFLMTGVYVYLGLLVYEVARRERGPVEVGAGAAPGQTVARSERPSGPAGQLHRGLARLRRPVAVLGAVGLVVALSSLVAWLALRYPGPQAIPGTYASLLLAGMVLGVVVVSTLIARGAGR